MEPVVEHHMELGANLARIQVKNKWNSVAVSHTVADINPSIGSRLPTGKLVSIRQGAVKHVDGTSPNMEIMELGAGPCLPAEELQGGPARVFTRDPIKDVYGVENC